MNRAMSEIGQLTGGEGQSKETFTSDYWEGHDTIKMSNVTFPGRHLQAFLFSMETPAPLIRTSYPSSLLHFHNIIYNLVTLDNVIYSFTLLTVYSYQTTSSRKQSLVLFY